MNRFRLISMIVLGFGAIASTLFIVENEVRGLRDDLQEINRQIHADREAIHIMQAEWAYLTQPERIAMLVMENLPELVQQQSSQYYSEKSAAIAISRMSKENQTASVMP